MNASAPSIPDSTLPKQGDLIAGKYRIERLLGRGGMGVVYAANHELLGVRVAVKVLLTDIASSPEAVSRFLNEARNAARIQSDNVARVMDVGTLDGGRPFMVIEYLDGDDLARVLETRGPLPLQEAVDYALQALEALAQAHVMGIVHRDLKPANLFLVRRQDRTTQVKVLDFGISKSTNILGQTSGQMTSTKELLGSPYYMSPEQLRSSKRVDARADIWSMGIILYELVCGLTPFQADTFGELFAAILEQDPPPVRAKRPDLPAAFEQVIARCLRRKVEERFNNVGELASALSPFASQRGQRTAQRILDVVPPGAVAPWHESGEQRSLPPELAMQPPPVVSGARAITPSPGGQTNGSWGTPVAAAPPARSSSSVAIISGAATMVIGLVAVGGFVAWHHWRTPAVGPDTVSSVAPSASAAPPGTAPSAAASAATTPSASASSAIATAAPTTPVASASAATAATTVKAHSASTATTTHVTTSTPTTRPTGGGTTYDPTRDSRR